MQNFAEQLGTRQVKDWMERQYGAQSSERVMAMALPPKRRRKRLTAPHRGGRDAVLLSAVSATAFMAVSATVSFASFTAHILELTRAPEPSAVAARLHLLDEIFWRAECL
jgi:hypothetical protein